MAVLELDRRCVNSGATNGRGLVLFLGLFIPSPRPRGSSAVAPLMMMVLSTNSSQAGSLSGDGRGMDGGSSDDLTGIRGGGCDGGGGVVGVVSSSLLFLSIPRPWMRPLMGLVCPALVLAGVVVVVVVGGWSCEPVELRTTDEDMVPLLTALPPFM